MSFQPHIITGRLFEVMESRTTKNGWVIRDFILEILSDDRQVQHRKMQAIKEVVEYLPSIKPGTEVRVEFVARGKRYKKPGEEYYSYYNIDEVRKVSLLHVIS